MSLKKFGHLFIDPTVILAARFVPDPFGPNNSGLLWVSEGDEVRQVNLPASPDTSALCAHLRNSGGLNTQSWWLKTTAIRSAGFERGRRNGTDTWEIGTVLIHIVASERGKWHPLEAIPAVDAEELFGQLSAEAARQA